jgi:hypothetical protein
MLSELVRQGLVWAATLALGSPRRERSRGRSSDELPGDALGYPQRRIALLGLVHGSPLRFGDDRHG